MKKTLLATAVASALLLSGCMTTNSAPAQQTATATQAAQQDIFTTPWTMEELPNGLKVIVVKTNYPGVVSMNIPVSTGSRNEVEEGKTGFAHFFEHMMFKGTDNMSADEYDRILKNAGVDNRAYTTDDYTNYYSSFSKEHLKKMLELEADRFQNLSYTEAQFRTEALTVKGEYLKNNANPFRRLFEKARDLGYDEHTYKHTTMGFFRDIEAMPDQMEYAKVFFDRFYRPENVSIVITGDVNPQETIGWVKEFWSDWKPGDYKASIPVEPRQKSAKYGHIEFEGMNGHWVSVAFHGPDFQPEQKDKPAIDLIGELFFSETSDIYQKLVVNEQKANQFFKWFPDRKDPTLMFLMAQVNNEEDVAYVKDEIAKTFAKARTSMVEAQKLADLKSNLKYSFVSELDSSTEIGSMLARYVHFERSPVVLNELYRSFDKVSAADIKEVANKYFQDDQFVTVTMSALPEIKGVDNNMSVDRYAKASDKPVNAKFAFLDKRNESALVDINFLFHTGAAEDPEGKKGLAALTAHMLAEGGSAAMSFSDIQRAMYPIAGRFGVQIDKEMISLSGRVHQDNLDKWYGLVQQQVLNPGWREEDFNRLKTQLLNEIKNDLKTANDEELGKEVLYAQLYEGHPYGSFNSGDISDLESITLEDVKAFYRDQFTQKRLTVGMTGNISDTFKAKLERDFASLPVGDKARVAVAKAPELKGRSATVVEKSAKSTAVSFGFPIDTIRSDKDWVALWLVRSYFGQHRSHNSFLYNRIRQERGMNYGDYAYIEYFPRGMFQTQPDANLGRSSQIFQIWLRPLRSNNDAHFATRVAMYELDKLINEGMTAENFENTKNFLYNFVPQLVASQDKQLGYALDSRFYNTDEFVAYVRKGLDALKLDDVNRVIRDNLQTDDIHYVFITGDGEDMKQRLVSEQISPLKYNSEKSQDILNEDKVIENLKLNLKGADVAITPVKDVFF